MKLIQEKSQVTVPPKPEGGNEWRSFADARSTGEAGFQHSNNASAITDVTMKTNYTPPGMDGSNQARKRINSMPLVMAGATDASHDTNAESFAKGFTRCHMSPTEDQYATDQFYAKVDEGADVGFVERGNYFDRS